MTRDRLAKLRDAAAQAQRDLQNYRLKQIDYTGSVKSGVATTAAYNTLRLNISAIHNTLAKELAL